MNNETTLNDDNDEKNAFEALAVDLLSGLQIGRKGEMKFTGLSLVFSANFPVKFTKTGGEKRCAITV